MLSVCASHACALLGIHLRISVCVSERTRFDFLRTTKLNWCREGTEWRWTARNYNFFEAILPNEATHSRDCKSVRVNVCHAGGSEAPECMTHSRTRPYIPESVWPHLTKWTRIVIRAHLHSVHSRGPIQYSRSYEILCHCIPDSWVFALK